MNREIKFRAWQTQYKEMYQPLDGYIEFPDIVVGFSDGDLRLDKDDVILQQFTGLKDKNGKDIYEGDVVKSDVGLCEVEWIGSGLSLHTLPRESSRSIFSVNYHECEVIGNIFENPELINQPLT